MGFDGGLEHVPSKQVYAIGISGTVSSAVKYYNALSGPGSWTSGGNDRYTVAAIDGVAKKLVVRPRLGGSNGEVVVVYLEINGVQTALSITVPLSAPVTPITVITDVAISEGDDLRIVCDRTAGVTGTFLAPAVSLVVDWD